MANLLGSFTIDLNAGLDPKSCSVVMIELSIFGDTCWARLAIMVVTMTVLDAENDWGKEFIRLVRFDNTNGGSWFIAVAIGIAVCGGI